MKTDNTAEKKMSTRTESENYIDEAKRLLKRFKKRSRFVDLPKNVFVTKSEDDMKASENLIYDDDTKHIKKVLSDNAKTKEGLRAIVAEIIRRRLNVLQSSQ